MLVSRATMAKGNAASSGSRATRTSPLFAEYRSHISGLFLDAPVVHHYQALA